MMMQVSTFLIWYLLSLSLFTLIDPQPKIIATSLLRARIKAFESAEIHWNEI